jgi:hypothetical protein
MHLFATVSADEVLESGKKIVSRRHDQDDSNGAVLPAPKTRANGAASIKRAKPVKPRSRVAITP